MFLQSFLTALEMLRMHKLRAFLTMLGVIIGVMAVSIIVMVSSGFQYYITNQFAKLGSDTITVVYDRWGDPSERNAKIDSLKLEDAEFIRNHVSNIDVVVPVIRGGTQKVAYGDRNLKDATVYASDENYLVLNRVDMVEGRILSADDVRNRANVCLIGEEVRDRLFPDKRALGKFINFADITLQVVGVVAKQEIFGQSNKKDILVPISTAQDKWIGGSTLEQINTRPKPGVKVQEAMDSVWQALMLKSGNQRAYRVDSNESIIKVFGGILGVAGSVLTAIAALSLLVGGIGIMNIMLVSVTERTKEIGLRKAVGAKRGAILTQFVVESATLSLIGGLIGMGLAYLLGLLVTRVTASIKWPSPDGLPAEFPIPAAIGAMIFSAFIGIVFGLYPAIAAARLDPIVALRRE
jgi:ABC-type antimicrobial peptide transport system permease subunit